MGKPKKGSKRPLRKSRAESMTGKEEGAVEMRTAAIGDNSQLPLPTPNDWNSHFKAIRRGRDALATAQGHLRNVIKAAKKSGIDIEALNEVVKIGRLNDPAKTVNFFKQLNLGLEQEGSALRLTVHDTLAGDEMEMVYKRGLADGKAGRGADNKYPEGSSLAEQYAKGWRHGTASNLGMSPEDSDAAIQDEPEKVAAE